MRQTHRPKDRIRLIQYYIDRIGDIIVRLREMPEDESYLSDKHKADAVRYLLDARSLLRLSKETSAREPEP